jgi:hypothetical protein
MRGGRSATIVTVMLAMLCVAATAPPRTSGGGKRTLPSYESRYYVIYTDLPEKVVREADLRMTAMVEEYRIRTREFSGEIRQKLPFYLFGNEQDYIDFGGIPGSAGIFDPASNELMAMTPGGKPNADSWHVIQHEGFHQFAAAVIGGELPIWVNEGLAEYFGEAIFTGDGFVTGVIPDWRLKRIQKSMRDGKFRPIHEMMQVSHRDWNDKLAIENYDQAWAMVHFLAQAEDGKYQPALVNFMRDVAKSVAWQTAWDNQFGSAEGFEEKWRAYWLNLSPDPTADAYARATVQTLTGALARAQLQKQQFKSIEELEQAILDGKLKVDPHDWMPTSVFDVALENLGHLRKIGAKLSLVSGQGRPPTVMCLLPTGTRWVGSFTVKANRVAQVKVARAGLPMAAPAARTAKPQAATGSGSPAPPRPQRR